MDKDSLIAFMDFARARLLGTIDTIEKNSQDPAPILSWRPAPGRAHIAWQLLHCAATHDKYLHVAIQGQPAPRDPAFVSAYGGGSIPADQNIPTLETIKRLLADNYKLVKDYFSSLTSTDLSKIIGPPDRRRSIAEAGLMLAWHESHHQGQAHLTWNLYKQSHNIP